MREGWGCVGTLVTEPLLQEPHSFDKAPPQKKNTQKTTTELNTPLYTCMTTPNDGLPGWVGVGRFDN